MGLIFYQFISLKNLIGTIFICAIPVNIINFSTKVDVIKNKISTFLEFNFLIYYIISYFSGQYYLF